MNDTDFTRIREILSNLDDEQIFGLARTVTQGLLKGTVHTREDALDVIFKYSTNEVSILRRRAITRDVLFNYLHANNVTVSIPTTKDKLIDQICMLWNIQNQEIQAQSNAIVLNDKSNDECNVKTMAKEFTQWFYEMMNLNEPLETSHFFPDAVLSLTMKSEDENIAFQQSVSLPNEIVQLLFKAKIEHQLLFNPNISSEGLHGEIDPHGLVVILACGTIHSGELCAGVFEQMFTLARDPICENNWKIKLTNINLKRMHVLEEPKLSKRTTSALVTY
nr:uncharacterized protein C3orf38 homolog [Onthophagus taurus]